MRPTILLIDDNPAVADIMRSLLQRNAYSVRVLTQPTEVLPFLAEQSVDVIVSDVMMPGMDGFELGKRLREDPATADIPLVYLTALNSMEDEFEGYLSGADAYLTKPFKAGDLLHAIQKVLNKNQNEVQSGRIANQDVARVISVVDASIEREVAGTVKKLGFEYHTEAELASALQRIDRERFHMFVVDASNNLESVASVQEFLAHFALAVPVVFLLAEGQEPPVNTDSVQFHFLNVPLDKSKLSELVQDQVTEFGGH
ncbi:MAG: response regulator [Planctomycetes bacterium]|nr:response regulator [Planctomycetota bacterium]